MSATERLFKKERSKNMSNKRIDKIYNFAKKNGALGGKLVGAGGGGFLIFFSNNTTLLSSKLFNKFGLKRLNYNFINSGVEILNNKQFL